MVGNPVDRRNEESCPGRLEEWRYQQSFESAIKSKDLITNGLLLTTQQQG